MDNVAIEKITPPNITLSGPVPRVVPLTIREAPTLEYYIENLVDWTIKKLIPFVDNTFKVLSETWDSNTNELITEWNNLSVKLVNQVQDIANGVGDSVQLAQDAQRAAELARDAAEQFASEAADVQDAALTTIIRNENSQAAQALGEMFVDAESYAQFSEMVGTLISNLQTTKVNLSVYNPFATATNNTLAGHTAAINTLGTVKADKTALEAVQEESAATARDMRDVAADAASGIFVRRNLFDRLAQGVQNPLTDTRVVFSGSSTSQGMSTYDWAGNAKMGIFQRLSCLAGSPTIIDGASVNAPVAAGTMRWYNFVGRDSATYMTAAFRANVANIRPNYVFHMIGSNDWSDGVSLATYRANVLAAVQAIEASTAGVVNVLIHQQPRRDGTRAIPWASYGQQLKDIVALRPASRVFVDLEEVFKPYDIVNTNRAGLVTSDNIHMGNVGHKLAADYLARLIGIPTPADFHTTDDIRGMAFGASGDKPTGTEIGQLPIESANYPRVASIEGTVFVRGGSGGEIYSGFITSANAQIGAQGGRNALNNADSPWSVSNKILIPPFTSGRLAMWISGAFYVSGNGTYSRVTATLTPA